MYKILKRTFLILCLFSLSHNARTQSGTVVGIFYDQDYSLDLMRIPLNEDRNYTMGLGLYLQAPSLKKFFGFVPLYFLNQVTGRRKLNDRMELDSKILNSIMLANGTFTPDSLSAIYPIYNDRPYASITYLEHRTSKLDQTNYEYSSAAFNIGILGSRVSREVQTFIHKRMNYGDTKAPRTPKGWGNQISNGGELTLMYSVEKDKLLTKKYIRSHKTSVLGLEFKHGIKYSLGYYTQAGYSMCFRFGKIDPRRWSYKIMPLSNSSELSDMGIINCNKSEYFFYGSLNPNFILYNALLNGQFRSSQTIVNFHETKHLVLNGEMGLVVSARVKKDKFLTARVRVSGRSPEINFPSRPKRFHYWGGIDLMYSIL